MMRLLTIMAAALLACGAAGAQNRWSVQPDGKTIRMEAEGDRIPHADHVEMSGKMMSVVLYWGIDEHGTFELDRSLVFPMLRTVPNNTHGSLMLRNDLDVASMLRVNNRPVALRSRAVELGGMMTVVSEYRSGREGETTALELTRRIFPSMEHPMLCERYTVRNTGDVQYALQIPMLSHAYKTDPARGVAGSYVVASDVQGGGVYTLGPGRASSSRSRCRPMPSRAVRPLGPM